MIPPKQPVGWALPCDEFYKLYGQIWSGIAILLKHLLEHVNCHNRNLKPSFLNRNAGAPHLYTYARDLEGAPKWIGRVTYNTLFSWLGEYANNMLPMILHNEHLKCQVELGAKGRWHSRLFVGRHIHGIIFKKTHTMSSAITYPIGPWISREAIFITQAVKMVAQHIFLY